MQIEIEFEGWAGKPMHGSLGDSKLSILSINGKYGNPVTKAAWEAWQACALRYLQNIVRLEEELEQHETDADNKLSAVQADNVRLRDERAMLADLLLEVKDKVVYPASHLSGKLGVTAECMGAHISSAISVPDVEAWKNEQRAAALDDAANKFPASIISTQEARLFLRGIATELRKRIQQPGSTT